MGCVGIGAGWLGARGGLSREMADCFAVFKETVPFSFARKSGQSPRRRDRRRSLRIEPLEARQVMSAAASAALVSSIWFAEVSTGADHAGTAAWTAEDTVVASAVTSDTTAVGNYDWIIQFDTETVDGIASVAQTIGLLTTDGIDFEIVKGLGLVGMVLVQSSGASIDEVERYLSGNAAVASYEEDACRATDATTFSSSFSTWDATAIDISGAYTLTTGSTSVVAAVIDTGVDYTHVALRSNIWTNPGEIAGNGVDDDGNGFVDDVRGWDFANNDANPMDDNSHGTHVSGTIVSLSHCSIMGLKFLGSDGSGYLSGAIEAVNYATMMRSRYGVNVRVDNNSWGGGGFSSALQSAMTAAADAGILVVAAAGNSATNNDTTGQYPANYANVLSVAASTQSNLLASFSNYGATTVDLAAPGVSITSSTPGNTYSTYSGTSMATPHVSAVAALAFALRPDATVAEVRDALVGGVTKVPSLSGKMVSGGVLNAYNTLKLLSDSQPSADPVVGSLTVSSSSVAIGGSVTLTASDITNATGSTTVRFVWDANNNGQYDSSDTVLGTSAAVSNGQCSFVFNTAGYTVGTYHLLAAAKNSGGSWSSWVAATLVVRPADDHGDNAAAATAVGVPSSTSGVIDSGSDEDWFAFTATAGSTYVFTVTLGTLDDSVLSLYSGNGVTRLAYNDDYGSTCASQITWTATAGGVYYLAVAGYGGEYTGSYTLGIASENSAPVLAPIGDKTVSYTQTSYAISVSASDANGDNLTYSVQVYTVDRLAQKAYYLDQTLGLHTYANGSYYTNARGAGEKYLLGNNNTLCFLRSDGSLYRWGGSIAKSTLVDTLSSAYYANPALLHSAAAPALAAAASSQVTAGVAGGVLTVTRAASYVGPLYVQVTVSDGAQADSETFKITDSLAQKAASLDQSLGLHTYPNGSYYTNARGAGEKYLLGTGGTLYFVTPNGSLYQWNGSIAKSKLVAAFSAAYYANPTMLCDAAALALGAARSSSLSCATESSTTLDHQTSLAGASIDGTAAAWLASEAGRRAVRESAVTPATAASGGNSTSLHDAVFGRPASRSSASPLKVATATEARIGTVGVGLFADALEEADATESKDRWHLSAGQSDDTWEAIDEAFASIENLLAAAG
jgi:subtilisin family serine protease